MMPRLQNIAGIVRANCKARKRQSCLEHYSWLIGIALLLLLINIGTASDAIAGGFGTPRWQRYDTMIRHISSRYRIDFRLIHAVIAQESAYNRFAVSSAGAQGLMQLMPGTARDLRVRNSFSDAQNIDGGIRYLIQQLHRFGSVKKALQAYNCGPERVSQGRVPRVSIRYANQVLARFYHIKKKSPIKAWVTATTQHEVVNVRQGR